MGTSERLPFLGGLEKSFTEEEFREAGALMTEEELLESLTPDQLVDFILDRGKRVSEIERTMSLASDVLEGAYGTTVEQLLSERNKNEQQT